MEVRGSRESNGESELVMSIFFSELIFREMIRSVFSIFIIFSDTYTCPYVALKV